MVDDQVCDDVDAGSVTPLDHVDELVAVARSRLELIGDWLVPGPPLRTLDVFIWGRHLRE